MIEIEMINKNIIKGLSQKNEYDVEKSFYRFIRHDNHCNNFEENDDDDDNDDLKIENFSEDKPEPLMEMKEANLNNEHIIVNNYSKFNVKNKDEILEKDNIIMIEDERLDTGYFYTIKENIIDIKALEEYNNNNLFPLKKDKSNIFILENGIFQTAKYNKNKNSNNNKIFGTYKENEEGIERPDNIRKKCKTGFFKLIKIWIKKTFKISFKFKHNFVIDVNKKANQLMLEKTLKEIVEEFEESNNDKKETIFNNEKFKVYKYIFDKTIKELFNEYLDSKEFERSYKKLDNPKKINDFITVAKDFVKYYSKSKIKNKCVSELDTNSLSIEL